MKYRVALAVVLAFYSTQVLSSDALSLAQKKGCFGCHDTTRTEVGPSWREVAEKYRENSNASHQLAGSILYGSMGNWGKRPMKGHAKKLNRDEALALAEFIMSLK